MLSSVFPQENATPAATPATPRIRLPMPVGSDSVVKFPKKGSLLDVSCLYILHVNDAFSYLSSIDSDLLFSCASETTYR